MTKTTKLTREEMLAKKGQTEKARYERNKNDPVKRAKQQEKERLKYLRKKEQGKVKAINDMTPREQRLVRKRRRDNVAAYRKRQSKLKDITNLFVRENTPDSLADEIPTQRIREDGRKVAAKKRSEKLRKIRNHTLQEQDREVKALKKKLRVYKKRLQRIKKKIKSTPYKLLTPNSQVNKMSNDSTPSARETVKKNLLFSEVMKRQLHENFSKLSSVKEKKTFTRAVTGNLVKKYKIHTEIGKISKKMMITATKSHSLLDHHRKSEPKINYNEIKNIVQRFLEEDSNSRLCAGKKECITRNKKKKQKRILADTMKNLHKKFLSSCKIIISYSIFCRFRPFWIVQPQANDRDTCLCITHANFDLLLQSLNLVNIITVPNHQKFLESICCDRYSETCLARKCQQCVTKTIQYKEFNNSYPINLKQWEIVTENIIDPKSKNLRNIRKYAKKNLKLAPREIIMRLENSFSKFFNHQFNIVHQYNEFKKLKDTISQDDCIIHMDFSENYNTKYAEEIQSFHFGGSRTQLSLHTVVIYTRNSDNSISTVCACTFANNLAHGPAAIWAHLKPIFELLPRQVVKIHFLSDGPVTQYRNKTMFYMLACQIQSIFPEIKRYTWNFHEAGHGKGAPDGVGAVCKRTADKFVALGKDIPSLDSLISIIKENCPGIRVFVISNEDIDRMTSLIAANAKNMIPFKGTLQVHQVCGNVYIPNKIVMKSLSCFCNEEGCNHYKLGELKYRNTTSTVLAVDDIYSASENELDEVTANLNTAQNPGPSRVSSLKKLHSPGDFVLVQLSGNRNKYYRYAAICSGDIDEEEGEIKVTYMKVCDNKGKLFKVDNDDMSYVALDQILCSLPLPELVMKGDRYFYKFSTAVDVFEK